MEQKDRSRARNRALADLAKKHSDEYRTLYRHHLSEMGFSGEARKVADEDFGVNKVTPGSDPVEVLSTRGRGTTAVCPHKNARKLQTGKWYCDACGSFV